jgi:multicomponent Na+:H+ antiporter subunit G
MDRIDVFNILSMIALLGGLFFMFIGAFGLWRLPDLFNRMHAATKCITLGITGMLIAVILRMAVQEGDAQQVSIVGGITKAILVIIFQFVAAPVASHMLSRAAHKDGLKQWEGTLSDDLAQDDAPVE